MSDKNDGGPAFPRPFSGGKEEGGFTQEQDGMSLRAYIATHCLSSILIGSLTDNGTAAAILEAKEKQNKTVQEAAVAIAVDYADALIAELEK